MTPKLTPVPGATPRYDDDGNEIVRVVTCGACGRSWNDAAISGITPAPSGRCPFEYDHEPEAEPSLAARILEHGRQLETLQEAIPTDDRNQNLDRAWKALDRALDAIMDAARALETQEGGPNA